MTKVTLDMDFEALDNLKTQMKDAGYVEFIWHKLFHDPSATFENLENHSTWNYPECWRARYYLNYQKHGHLLKDKKILEIGSNLNFYSVWSIQAGAKSVHGLEPNQDRYKLGKEYIKIRKSIKQISVENTSIELFMEKYDGQKYDVVFFQDVLYYLHDPLKVLHFIRYVIKPKYLFLESTVVIDHGELGHFSLWDPSTKTEKMQIWEGKEITMALKPSRNALQTIINSQNWKIITYYDYMDFKGHGESPPRKAGNKDYYVLELTE